MSTLTNDLARLANSANVLASAITTNSSAITSVNVGGVAINSSSISGVVSFANDVTITGNLTVTGTTLTVNTTTLDVKDLNITVAKGSGGGSSANGAGLYVDGTNASLFWSSAANSWTSNVGLNVLSGNVGIGTVSPASKLSVYGDIAVGLDSVTRGILLGPTGYEATIKYNTNGNLDITPRSGFNTIFIGGKIGVGLTNPNTKFHVYSGESNTYISVDAAGTGGSKRWDIGVNYSNSSVAYPNFGFSINDGYNANNVFYIDWNSYNTYLVPLKGDVGIGNTSPVAKLHITSNERGGDALRLNSSNSYGISMIFISSANNGRNYRIGSNFVNGYGEFSFYDATAGVERMSIANNGSVSIGSYGATAYGSRLSIVGPSTGSQTSMFIWSPGLGSGQIGIYPGSSNLKLYNTYSDGTLANGKGVDIDTGGSVGIGCSPSHRVDIQYTGQNILRLKGGSANNQGSAFYISRSTDAGSTLCAFGDSACIIGGATDQTAMVWSGGGVNALRMYMGGEDKMWIAANGNVGIGTTSPAVKLDVQGSGGYVINRVIASDGSLTRFQLTNSNRNWSISNYGSQVSPNGSFAIADETAGAVRLTIDTAGVITTAGHLNISNHGYAKRRFHASGNYTSATWYEICNSSNLTEAGIYIVKSYASTYSASGAFYDWYYSSVPFYWFVGATNSANAFNFPALMGSGHADNGCIISLRIRQTSQSTDGKSYVDFQINTNLTGIDQTAGKQLYFDFIRMA